MERHFVSPPQQQDSKWPNNNIILSFIVRHDKHYIQVGFILNGERSDLWMAYYRYYIDRNKVSIDHIPTRNGNNMRHSLKSGQSWTLILPGSLSTLPDSIELLWRGIALLLQRKRRGTMMPLSISVNSLLFSISPYCVDFSRSLHSNELSGTGSFLIIKVGLDNFNKLLLLLPLLLLQILYLYCLIKYLK